MPMNAEEAAQSAYETAAWLRANGSPAAADGLEHDVFAIMSDLHCLGVVGRPRHPSQPKRRPWWVRLARRLV